MKLVEASRPDVAVIDIRLKTGNGLDLIRRMKEASPSTRILVWSMFPDTVYARRALQAGALGYINKAQATNHIIDALRRVRDGKFYFSEAVSEQVLGQLARGGKQSQTSPIESLSDRELEVFRLLGQGHSSADVAKQLHRSKPTIEAHRRNIKRKLNLTSAAALNRAAVVWAHEQGETG